jgi:hypothetical protein
MLGIGLVVPALYAVWSRPKSWHLVFAGLPSGSKVGSSIAPHTPRWLVSFAACASIGFEWKGST